MSVFDEVPAGSRLYEDDHFFIIRDGYPVSPGHLLIVSKRAAVTFFDLNGRERAALPAAIAEAKRLIEEGVAIDGHLGKKTDASVHGDGAAPDSRSPADAALDQTSVNATPIPKPDGHNIGMNCGGAAGQTVMHFHCHVIPRYHGDTPNPRGGVRHCIPGRGDY
jgi:diadenosine tetraphosphate (Ap4A) HIT family hydrolase